MIFYPTTQCPNFDIYPVPKSNPDSMSCVVKVGCRRCEVCNAERMEQKQMKWRSRIREMMLHYEKNGDRVVFCTFTVHDDDVEMFGMVDDEWQSGKASMLGDDNPPMTAEQKRYNLLKSRLSKMFNATKMAVSRWYDTTTPSDLIKYWAVLEHGEKTGRLHAHVFFFVDKSVVWSPLWTWMSAYYTKRYLAYILDAKLVVGARMAANYATKYAVKQIGLKSDRMLSSQFGWVSFMEEVKKEWLGIEKGADGIRRWEAVAVPDLSEKDAIRVLNGNVVRAVELINQYKVVGTLEVDKPVLHPYGASVLKMEGDLCEENEGEIGISTIRHTLIFLPENYGLQRLRRLGLEKLSREFERVRDL